MKIKCRSQLSKQCYDGMEVEHSIYAWDGPEEAERNYRADGTFDPGDNSVICDACTLTQERKAGSPFAHLIPEDLI